MELTKLGVWECWRWSGIYKQLEKLECAKAAYLWFHFLAHGYLSLPFLTFPYLSLPFLHTNF